MCKNVYSRAKCKRGGESQGDMASYPLFEKLDLFL